MTYRQLGFFSIALIFGILTAFVGLRDLSVGTDTGNYSFFFLSLYAKYNWKDYDTGFVYLTELIKLTTSDYRVYFSALYLIFNISLLLSSRRFLPKISVVNLLMLSGFMLISSWYENATINALRHGLALPFLYISLVNFHDRKFVKSALAFIVSVSFHFSVLMVIPFYILIYFRFMTVFYIFVSLAISYATGLSSILLQFVLNIFSLPFYTEILDHAPESGEYFGFSLNLFLYSVFWGVLSFFLERFVKEEFVHIYRFSVKMYCILIMPYFAFAHGSVPSRFAFVAWLFIPILQSSFLSSCKISDAGKVYIASFLFVVGICKYLLVLNSVI
jgi:hypothetical protein